MVLFRITLFVSAFVGSIGIFDDAKAASDNSLAGANIINSLSVTKTADMDIGKIVPSMQGGVIQIGTAGVATCDAALTCLSDSIQPARFSIRGQAGYAYAVTLPDEIVMSNGNAQLKVTSLSSSVGMVGHLDTSGEGELVVGGSVQVGEHQKTGSYSGQFHITLEYN